MACRPNAWLSAWFLSTLMASSSRSSIRVPCSTYTVFSLHAQPYICLLNLILHFNPPPSKTSSSSSSSNNSNKVT
jgi:hypothetical protein